MKTLASLLLLVTALSAQAESIICHEIYNPAVEVLRARTILEIENLADIAATHPERGSYDNIMKVRVTIKQRLGSKVNVVQKFESVSKSEDVNYHVSSKKNGFYFMVYLDEMEDARLDYKNAAGKEVKLNVKCDYKNN